MKTKNTELIESMDTYAKEHSSDYDKVTAIYKRRFYLDDLNAYLRNRIGRTIDVGVGMVCSKIALVIPEKDKAVMDFYREWMTAKGIPMHDIYITYLRKGPAGFEEDYEMVIKKEMLVFKNDGIIINHTEVELEGNVKRINHGHFTEMLDLISRSKEDGFSEEDAASLATMKKDYWLAVRETLNYKNV